jgi:hypothetical protein
LLSLQENLIFVRGREGNKVGKDRIEEPSEDQAGISLVKSRAIMHKASYHDMVLGGVIEAFNVGKAKSPELALPGPVVMRYGFS